MFVWSNQISGLHVYMQNNPETGEYAAVGQRPDELGFASYIGVEGPRDEVDKFVALVKRWAVDIKGESLGRRDFI